MRVLGRLARTLGALLPALVGCNALTHIDDYRVCSSCGDGSAETSDSSSDADAPISADAACSEYATVLCERYSTCSKYDLELFFGPVGACIERARKLCLFSLAAAGSALT